MGQRFGQLSEFRDRQRRYRPVGYGRTSLTVLSRFPPCLWHQDHSRFYLI
jgi:hypothetical protein